MCGVIILPIAVGGSTFIGCIYLLLAFYVEFKILIFLLKKLFWLSKKIILFVWKMLRSSRTRQAFDLFCVAVLDSVCAFQNRLKQISFWDCLLALFAALLAIPLSIIVGFFNGALAILFGYSTEMADTILALYSWGSWPILIFIIFRYVKRFLQKRFFSHAEAC